MMLKYICHCGHFILRPITFYQKILSGTTYCPKCNNSIIFFMVVDEKTKEEKVIQLANDFISFIESEPTLNYNLHTQLRTIHKAFDYIKANL